jgi:exosortase H (IPTLxxWG-CTERM-specific)
MNRIWPKLDPLAVRFVLMFFLCVAVLSLVVQVPWINDRIIIPYTTFLARVCAKALALGGYAVSAEGPALVWKGIVVSIRKGCDGLEAAILLISACLAYPARWKSKMIGTLIGFALIFVLNLIRIVVLAYLGFTGTQESFDFAHIYVAQFAIIAVTMVFWVFWAGKQKPIRS